MRDENDSLKRAGEAHDRLRTAGTESDRLRTAGAENDRLQTNELHRETMNHYRKKMKSLRDALPAGIREEKSRSITQLLDNCPEVIRAGRIFSFASFGSEVDLWPAMQEWLEAGRKLALPRTQGKEIHFYTYDADTELIRHRYGILEPVGEEEILPEAGDVILVPGLVFSDSGHRIGYGGGFYDRYLASHPGITAIGVAFEEQRGEFEPAEWDEKLDALVTDRGRYDFPAEMTDTCRAERP